MSKISVSVSGTNGVGKSAVIQIIQEALAAKGIDVEWVEPEHGARDDECLQACVDSIRKRNVKVTLFEKQTF